MFAPVKMPIKTEIKTKKETSRFYAEVSSITADNVHMTRRQTADKYVIWKHADDIGPDI